LSLLGSLPASEKASAEAFLGALFEVVEASKQRYGILKEEEDADLAFMIEYGLSVFKKADDEDRAGAASKETAVRFVSAANVLDVPRILDLNDPKLDSMIKYAKGRAGEIVKAVNEGRPIPAPQGSDGSFGTYRVHYYTIYWLSCR
jgi:vacuolar protein sorting-associated protein VTA1